MTRKNIKLNMARCSRTMMLIASVFFVSISSIAKTIYVNLAATGSNNGTSWSSAYKNLQNAIDAASVGDEIRVASGTYYPTESPTGSTTDSRDKAFHFNKNIILSGGWNPISDKQQGATSVLSGDLVTAGTASDSAYHVLVTANLNSSTKISNFTMVGAKANGAGTYSYSSQAFSRVYGGAISNMSSSPTIENVVLDHNQATYGGGVCNQVGSNPKFYNVMFSNNVSSVGGAMTNFTNSNVAVYNCSFLFNKSTSSLVGALHNDGSESSIYNSVFYGNVNSSSKSTATGNLHSSSTHNALDYRPNDWPNTKIDISSKSTTDLFKNRADPSGSDGKWGTTDDGYNLAASSDLAENGSATYSPTYDIRGAFRFAPPSIGVYEEALGEGFVPLKVTGFNHDVVAESGNDPAKVTTTSMDDPTVSVRNAMYSKSYRYTNGIGQYGLPDNGKIVSDVNEGVNYQLEPYSGNNVLILDGNDVDTLVLAEPGVFKSMAILAASTDGASNFSVTCIYNDGTTKVESFSVADWYDGANPAITGYGRVKVTTGVYEDDPKNPRLYDNILQLESDKVVNKIVFSKQSSSSRSCIFALCGLTPPGVPDWPVATNATNIVNGTGFTANWNSVDKADGYIIDVATNNEFTNESLVKGYVNKSLGNVTSVNVNTTATVLYYRIRAYNAAGQSVNSNIIRVKLGIDASDFVAIPLSGFNADLVAEGTGKDASAVTTNTFDFPNGTFSDYVLFTEEFRYGATEGRFGIPNDGKILSASNPGVNYQLMDYTKDNVLLLIGSDSGELTLDLADVYDKLIILSASAEGASSFNVTVTYSDGTTQAKTFTVADWYDGPNPAIQGFGRVQRTTDNYDTVRVDNPRLYDSELDVNATKVVTKLKFRKVNSTSRTGIFAVCGLTPAGVPKAPTAIDGKSNGDCSGFTIKWNKDDEVSGYYIDVATDSLFTNIVADYSNKDMGLDTSEYVATNVNVFFRVRSKNSFGQSISSKVVKAVRDRTTFDVVEASCDSFSWKNSTYNQSGSYEYLTTNSVGCDSVVQLQLTISESSVSSVTVSGCGSVEVNGQNYNTTGIFTQTIPNEAGCDSVITVNTSVSPSEFDAEFVIATQLISNTDVSIVNITQETPDSSRWILPNVAGITILKDTTTELLIQFPDSGAYDIGLKTYKDNCSNYTSKSIYVLKGSDLPKVEGRSPFIRNFTCFPNPSNGNFTSKIVLSAVSDVRLRTIDANTSMTVDDRTLSGDKSYEELFSLSLKPGVYIMFLETPKGNLIQRLVINN